MGRVDDQLLKRLLEQADRAPFVELGAEVVWAIERFETLDLPNDGDQRLTTWFPDDESSEAALRLAIHPAPLRVVRPA